MTYFLSLTILIIIVLNFLSCQRLSRDRVSEFQKQRRQRLSQDQESRNQRRQSAIIGSLHARARATACPPLLGDDPPSGCSKTYIEDFDGQISCDSDQDCPNNKQWWIEEGCSFNGNTTSVNMVYCNRDGFCDSCQQSRHKCNNSRSLGSCPPRTSRGSKPIYVSPTSKVGVKPSCRYCDVIKQCRPDRPCVLHGQCSQPFCTRRGRCWCPRK